MKLKKQKEFEGWYNLSETEREARGLPKNKMGMVKYLAVSYPTILTWAKRLDSPKLTDEQIEDSEFDENNPLEWWRKQNLRINKAIVASAIKGNSMSQKLAKQLSGELVEKREVKIGLKSDDYFRIIQEAEQRVRGESDRDRGGETESSLLLSESGVYSEQEHNKDS